MEKIVFTNGCFDIIHPGHIDLLRRARALGTKLIVGINSDASVRAIKGKNKPVINQTDRAEILRAVRFVDEVVIFDELTPERLIREIKPDVLVKGGDWKTSEIIGADFVTANGGEVYSLPLKDDYSSSGIVKKIKNQTKSDGNFSKTESLSTVAENVLTNHLEVFETLLSDYVSEINECASVILETFKSGKKLLICGNGGSAADAQHIAAEFVGRFEKERKSLPAIALTTDTSLLTALSNDYDFKYVFARQIEGIANEGDLLIAISTSGNSENINRAVAEAKKKNCKTMALTGAGGEKFAAACDFALQIPSQKTARIQEAHIAVAHIWCEIIDAEISKSS